MTAHRSWSACAAIILVACTGLALATMQAGGDYFIDSGSIDALVRGDLRSFFSEQPLMGPISLLLRAPFVAPVFRSSLPTVYYAGVIPCYGCLLVLALVLWRRMAGRSTAERLGVVLLCAGSPVVVRAVHWGHPEELVAAALCVGALLAAIADRPLLAGALLGCGFATKQWALIAAAPALAALPSRRPAFVATATLVGAAFTLPMLIGDPDRFWLVTKAAGSADPSGALGLRPGPFPDGRVLPHSLWMPFGSPEVVEGRRYLFIAPALARITHPLILLVGLPAAWLSWRRARGPISALDALRLLALVFLLRAALDPNDLDYYHVPLMATLAALAALGGPKELRAALLTGAGLGIAFALPADTLAALTEHAWPEWLLYMGTIVPLGVWLLRGLFGAPQRAVAITARRTREVPA